MYLYFCCKLAFMPTAREVLIFWEQIGLTDVVLPFLLAFTLVFGILQRSKVLGTEDGHPKTNINAMVALVLGFFVVLTVRTLNIINLLAQYLALLLVAAVMLGILMAFLGAQKKYRHALTWLVGIGLVSVVLFVFGQAGILDQRTLQSFFLPVLAIAAFVGLLWFMLRPAEAAAPQRPAQAPSAAPARAPAQPRRGGTPAREIRPGEEREL
jgi:hypothetical protein